MFYSHEVLTSRKYGVATVWLVATLGSKSSLKKVSRKAILDVDVTKACETIVAPDAPMALRLQSNLLYGVTRVYAQQCGYVLHDAEAARTSLRAVFKVVKVASLDAEGGHKGRSDQLVLQDDPGFLPGLDIMDIDVDLARMLTPGFGESQQSSLSPHSSSQRTTTIGSQEEIGGLMIPPSASSFVGGAVGGMGGFSIRGDSGPGSRAASGVFQQREPNEAFLLEEDDLGLELGEEATTQNIDLVARRASRAAAGGSTTVARARPAAADVNMESDRDEQQSDALPVPEEDGFVQMQDDDGYNMIFSEGLGDAQLEEQQLQSTTSTETASAQMANHRTRKIIQLDRTQVLSNRTIAEWGNNYLVNMHEAILHKQPARLAALAKKNAAKLMLSDSEGPLAMFSGKQLFEALTGLKLTTAGEKRARDEPEGSDSSRRVRSRGEPSSDQQGRGFPSEEDGFQPMHVDDEIERGREQPTPLDDRRQSSLGALLPWNQSTGSRRPTGVFSAGAGSALPLYSLSRRGSRLTSASPLIGRGGVGDFGMDDTQRSITALGDDEFELYGPAAQVDTQTAAQSQWIRSALDGESMNFLSFVEAGIDELDQEREQAAPGDEEDERMMNTVDFDHLLSPASNTCIVAAQGLLHVLALGTKSLISVAQDEPFGPIRMKMI